MTEYRLFVGHKFGVENNVDLNSLKINTDFKILEVPT